MRGNRKRWSVIAGAAAIAATVAAGAFGLRFGYEHAQYDVVAQHDAFEIRRYAPRVVAEVVVDATDGRRAVSEGFRLLADYIFGNNLAVSPSDISSEVSPDRSQKIAMTTPVDRIAEGGRWRVRFTMPSEYTLADLPVPVDGRVRLVELDAAVVASVRFSGSPSESAVDERTRRLLDAVEDEGLTRAPDREPVYARYDPPWTPSFLRRNEILVELETT